MVYIYRTCLIHAVSGFILIFKNITFVTECITNTISVEYQQSYSADLIVEDTKVIKKLLPSPISEYVARNITSRHLSPTSLKQLVLSAYNHFKKDPNSLNLSYSALVDLELACVKLINEQVLFVLRSLLIFFLSHDNCRREYQRDVVSRCIKILVLLFQQSISTRSHIHEQVHKLFSSYSFSSLEGIFFLGSNSAIQLFLSRDTGKSQQ